VQLTDKKSPNHPIGAIKKSGFDQAVGEPVEPAT